MVLHHLGQNITSNKILILVINYASGSRRSTDKNFGHDARLFEWFEDEDEKASDEEGEGHLPNENRDRLNQGILRFP